ncbi:MAG: OsmC family protein [Acidobacteria bacterium]|nr:OsmC family protein [Acidobacteriota bacterium]
MITRRSEAEWRGGLKDGAGKIKFGSGAYEGPYNFSSRFEGGAATNPEELMAASHAGCFSMAFSLFLGMANFTATRIHTTAAVKLEQVGGGFDITHIQLTMEAVIPGITEGQFQELAKQAKENCPISKALASVPIDLTATLA